MSLSRVDPQQPRVSKGGGVVDAGEQVDNGAAIIDEASLKLVPQSILSHACRGSDGDRS